MKELSLQDRKVIQIAMLSEIDSFCRVNRIRYSLAYGTLLGAVRHKGYIPWDDDIDIMMPLPDLLRFKELFVSSSLKFCDVDTQDGYDMDFPRITHSRTYKIEGKGFISYGVFIDVYPVIGLPDSLEEQDSFFFTLSKLESKRQKMKKIRRRVLNHCQINTIPGFKSSIKRVVRFERSSNPYEESHQFYVISAPLENRKQNTFSFDLFAEMTELEFEGQLYYCISSYDRFLTHRYGDYMQLPPESERQPYHNATYYWCEF